MNVKQTAKMCLYAGSQKESTFSADTTTVRWAKRPWQWITILLALIIPAKAFATVPSNSEFTYEGSPVFESGTMPYRMYKPPTYSGSGTKTYPLLIWLGGLGERGTNNTSQLANGVQNLVSSTNQAYDPAFLIVPQIDTSTGSWAGADNPASVKAETRLLMIIDDLKTRYRIDPDRICIMGLSQGGGGTWAFGARYPGLFAAISPMSMSYTYNSEGLSLLVNRPVWGFNSANDSSGVTTAVSSLRDLGGRPVFTLHQLGGHSGPWVPMSKSFDVYKWFMAQRRLCPQAGFPSIGVTNPSSTRSYSTENSTITLSGTATPSSLMAGFSAQCGKLGGGWTNATGSTVWSGSPISLSGTAGDMMRVIATGTYPAGTFDDATLGLTTTTFSDGLVVNDATPPSLTVINPTTSGTYTSPTDFLTLRGHASDNQAVTQIAWSNDRGGNGLAGADIDNLIAGRLSWFIHKLPLQIGHNIITITASDLSGNSTSQTLDVFRSPSCGGDFFRQDFTSTSVSSYINTTANPDTGQFYDIGAQTNGGTWSTDGAGLQLTRTVTGGTDNFSAGFVRKTLMDGPPQGVIAASFDVSVPVGNQTTNNFAKLTFGFLLSNTTGYSGNGYSDLNTELAFNGAGANKFTLKLNSTQASTTFNCDGTVYHTVWYVNSSGTSQTYLDPNGTNQTLSDNCSDVWVNGIRVITNAAKYASYTSRNLGYFRLITSGSEALTLRLANLVMSDFTVNPPTLAIANPTSESTYTTGLNTVNLSGTASSGVSQVTWNNDRGGSGTATGTTNWSVNDIPLQSGVNVITITVKDANNIANNQILTVTYISNGSAPVAVNDSAALKQNATVDVPVLANDIGWSLTLASVGTPSHGTASIVSGTMVHYEPATDYYGADAVSYVITDGTTPATGTVAFTVNRLNVTPTAVNDTATLNQNTTVDVNVLANDSGATDWPGTLSLVSVGTPSHGTASIVSGTLVRYVPTINYYGSDAVTYTLTNGKAQATGTVNFTVAPVGLHTVLYDFGSINTAGNWNNVTTTGTGIKIADSKDTDGATTGVALNVTAQFIAITTQGSTSTTGAYPATAIQDSFYTQNTTVAKIRLEGLSLVSKYKLTFFASRLTVSGSRVTRYTVGTSSAILDATDNTNNTVALSDLTPAADGTIEIQITNDAGLGYAYIGVLQVDWGTAASNIAPVAGNDTATLNENTTIDVAVLANDSDPDSGPQSLSLTSVGTPTHGTASIVSGSMVHYIPTSNYYGEDALTYTITDGAAQATGTVNFTVISTLDAWKSTQFGANASNPAIAGDTADADGDGVPNLMEYALSRDPNAASGASPLIVSTGSNQLRIGFTRLEPADVTYIVKSSTDLTHWTTISTFPSNGSAWTGAAVVNETGSGSIRNVTVMDTAPLTSGSCRYLRLEVTHP